MRRLPPLNAVRAFEASARNLSFKRAAEELNVTQSAVSHQVRILEEHLNVLLFRRMPSGVELTSSAEAILPAATKAFDALHRAMAEIRSNRRGVMVHCSMSFAMRCLLPRIGQFERAYPEIIVRLSTGPAPDPTIRKMLDVEVVYEAGTSKSKSAAHLLDEWLLPVCAPDFLGSRQLDPIEVIDFRLLENSPGGWDWIQWGKHHDIPVETMKDSLANAISFDAGTFAIETAASGQGVALANLYFARPELNSGALVPAVTTQPFKLGAHYLIQRPSQSQAVKSVVRWLLEKSEDTSSQLIADLKARHSV